MALVALGKLLAITLDRALEARFQNRDLWLVAVEQPAARLAALTNRLADWHRA